MFLRSSQSGESSSSEDENPTQSFRYNGPATAPNFEEKQSPVATSNVNDTEASSRSSTPSLIPPSSPARRSRSPDVKPLSNLQNTAVLPSASFQNIYNRNKLYSSIQPRRCLFPTTFCISLPLPWGRHVRKVTGDFRKAGENIILLVSLIYGILCVLGSSSNENNWIAIGQLTSNLLRD